MDGEPKRPRLNILQRAARAKRISDRLREGWAYDEIAREERVSPERIRQIAAGHPLARERLIAKLNAMAAAVADEQEDSLEPAEQPASPEEATKKIFSAPSAISP